MNIGLSGYGAYESFSNGNFAQGLFRLGTGAYFGLRQFGYNLSFAPAEEAGTFTLTSRLLPVRIARQAAMQDMLMEDLAELSPEDRAFYKQPSNNSLASLKEAWGYRLIGKANGAVLKFGETTQGYGRYSKAYLNRISARMQLIETGSKAEMYDWQHQQILQYKAANGGARPPLNMNDY